MPEQPVRSPSFLGFTQLARLRNAAAGDSAEPMIVDPPEPALVLSSKTVEPIAPTDVRPKQVIEPAAPMEVHHTLPSITHSPSSKLDPADERSDATGYPIADELPPLAEPFVSTRKRATTKSKRWRRPSTERRKRSRDAESPIQNTLAPSVVEELVLPQVVEELLTQRRSEWSRLVRRLRQQAIHEGCRTIMVTSVEKGVGVTTVSIALAVALADDAGDRVALVDGDFETPELANQLGLTPRVGLDDVLADDAKLDQAIYRCEEPPLSILPIREKVDRLPTSLRGARWDRQWLNWRRGQDFVIIDAGRQPMIGTRRLLIEADAVLGVRRSNSGELAASWKTLEKRLRADGCPLLGVVDNAA